MTKYLISISEAANLLGVCIATLREWDNKLKPVLTQGGHRRYKMTDIEQLQKTRLDDSILFQDFFPNLANAIREDIWMQALKELEASHAISTGGLEIEEFAEFQHNNNGTMTGIKLKLSDEDIGRIKLRMQSIIIKRLSNKI